jgi:hypothetical protein
MIIVNDYKIRRSVEFLLGLLGLQGGDASAAVVEGRVRVAHEDLPILLAGLLLLVVPAYARGFADWEHACEF